MSQKITKEKARRIAVSATAAGVLLIVFLAIILIVQFVQMGVANSKKQRLDEQIEEYEQAIESGKDDLDWYRSGNGLYWYARTYGYT